MQRVVPNADHPKLFEAGRTFNSFTRDGLSIIEAPTEEWVDLVKADATNRTSKED